MGWAVFLKQAISAQTTFVNPPNAWPLRVRYWITEMKRELKIDMIALDSAFESGMDMFAFYLDAETGKIASVSDDDRFTLEQIYESFISRMCCWIIQKNGSAGFCSSRSDYTSESSTGSSQKIFPSSKKERSNLRSFGAKQISRWRLSVDRDMCANRSIITARQRTMF